MTALSADGKVSQVSPRHDPASRGFASDNYSGIHPEVLAAIAAANDGHQVSYGDDTYTEHLQAVFRSHFGDQAVAYPVFNGTGANVVALQSVTDRWASVVCTANSHINTDECGAPEKVGGLKLYSVPTPDGKLTPELVDREARGFQDEHRAQPQVVSLTQSTEVGTVYSVAEVRAICEHAHSLGMRVHVDGSRLSNAAATLGVPFREFTTDAGVDVLSFGGTKNGLMVGEVVVVLTPDCAHGMKYVRKSAMQLASKMRFVSVQFEALLGGDLWLRNASHANAMARRLADGVRDVPGVTVTQDVQANAVFAVLPPEVTARLQQRFRFYTWDEHTGEVRWMCAFDTTEQDVDGFVTGIREELAAAQA
jgi:threonine aldolase